MVGRTPFIISTFGDVFVPGDLTVSGGSSSFFRTNSVFVGSITVAGSGVVSYNAFTGSHYADVDQPLQQGILVRMTGENRRLREAPDAEIVYGVTRSAAANEAGILGSYLGPQQDDELASERAPHLVMAAGNGEVLGGGYRPRHRARRLPGLLAGARPRHGR
jgi:hypothetical protein